MKKLNLILKKQEQTLVEHLGRIELLETNNSTLRKENLELKWQINDLEQYSRTNCVEISGVPELKNENTMSVVEAVGTDLGLNLDSYTIDTCHQLKKNFNNQPRNIIVKFVRRLDKEEFLRCRRIKQNLSVNDLHGDMRNPANSNNTIYINESLTFYNRQLCAKARAFKREKNIKFLWIRNGKILMRANKNSKIFDIASETDLNDVH
ncbi:hypothetical protein RN001_012503 [Aquatica leii]|uniref:Uncharacterized protein n=1 Tax=Aquatica leii TaxID=1421715 RepID=A0AAN7P7D1_9COLE|nr:hypothetical protein RN001_012503 [Aquatica leii]